MSYDWNFHHLMNDIAQGKKNANEIQKHFSRVDSLFPGNSYVMEFTSNHDENTWNGSEYERLGQGAQTFAVLAATVYGMPLLYNGQESAFSRRLKFFDKDSIDWGTYPLTEFYHKLISLKHRNRALWNGDEGGKIQRIKTKRDTSVFAFVREKENDQVFVVCNLCSKPIEVGIGSKSLKGHYRDVLSNNIYSFPEDSILDLTPWQYLVCEKTHE